MFVGDGINDLVALSVADVGFAVGATEAMVAAAISTSRNSVAGTQELLQILHALMYIHPAFWVFTAVLVLRMTNART